MEGQETATIREDNCVCANFIQEISCEHFVWKM